MNLKRTAVIAALIIIGPGCNSSRVMDAGSAAPPASIATAVVDVILMEDAGKIPGIYKFTVPKSSIKRVASGSSATLGIVAFLLVATADDLGLRPAGASAAAPFKKIQLTVGGKKTTSKYDDEIFGAFACGTAAAARNGKAAKGVKATIRAKGTTSQAAGTGVSAGVAQVELGADVSKEDFDAACKAGLDGILRVVGPAIGAQIGLVLPR